MAKDQAKLTRRRALAFKVEATTGTQEALTASEANIDAIEPNITFDDEGTPRQGASLSSRKRKAGAQSGSIEFRCHLSGSGPSQVPALANLLTCCGFKLNGGTLTPLGPTDVGNTGTFGLYKHGRFKSLFGVMLDFTMTGTRGNPVEVAFTGRGKRAIGSTNGPRDVAMITPSYLSVLPPVLKGCTFTIGSTTYRIPGFELAAGNDVQLRQDITDATGFHAAQVVAHERRLMISPEALPLSTQDWYDVYESETEMSWSAVIGSDAGNIITITAPALQLAQPPEDEDDNGIFRDSLVFQLNQGTDAGDDELEIEFDLGS